MPEQLSVPPVRLILALDVPLTNSCKVLVRLIVPLTVMISPGLALATAVFNADSVVTVVEVIGDKLNGLCCSLAAAISGDCATVDPFSFLHADTLTASKITVNSFFINVFVRLVINWFEQ